MDGLCHRGDGGRRVIIPTTQGNSLQGSRHPQIIRRPRPHQPCAKRGDPQAPLRAVPRLVPALRSVLPATRCPQTPSFCTAAVRVSSSLSVFPFPLPPAPGIRALSSGAPEGPRRARQVTARGETLGFGSRAGLRARVGKEAGRWRGLARPGGQRAPPASGRRGPFRPGSGRWPGSGVRVSAGAARGNAPGLLPTPAAPARGREPGGPAQRPSSRLWHRDAPSRPLNALPVFYPRVKSRKPEME